MTAPTPERVEALTQEEIAGWTKSVRDGGCDYTASILESLQSDLATLREQLESAKLQAMQKDCELACAVEDVARLVAEREADKVTIERLQQAFNAGDAQAKALSEDVSELIERHFKAGRSATAYTLNSLATECNALKAEREALMPALRFALYALDDERWGTVNPGLKVQFTPEAVSALRAAVEQ